MLVWTKPPTKELGESGVVQLTTTGGWTIEFGLRLVMRTLLLLITHGTAHTFGMLVAFHKNILAKNW